jgi:hypothetical protein
MPLSLLLGALTLAGWACMAGGVALAGAAFLLPASPWPAALLAAAAVGAGVVAGLMLLGFAANLRLIAALLDQRDGAARRRDGS